jgi:hypothetical protein
MKTLTAWFLTVVTLLSFTCPTASAKQVGDWNAVKNLTGQEIAIETKRGATIFGLLQFANDAELRIQIAEKKYITIDERIYSRDEIGKVWRANLRFGESKIVQGALIGAGAGVAYVGVAILAEKGTTARDFSFAIPGALCGALVGGLIGASQRKGHKKEKLIYSTKG